MTPPVSTSPRPLDGMTVLDLTANVAGPLACQVLVDLGARVIKVEPPGGEAGRRITAAAVGLPRLAPYFAPHNRGKESVVVDLDRPEGVETLLRLVDGADVFVDGFRPGALDRRDLGAAAIQQRNPSCIHAAISAFGGTGEAGRRPGVDMIVQAEAGCTTGLRQVDGSPQVIPFQLVDAATGHVLAQAVLAALLHRERHGIAERITVAMYDVACSLQANHLTLQLNRPPEKPRAPSGTPDAPAARRKSVAVEPSGVYPAADGYLVLAAYVPRHFGRFAELLGRPDLTTDPRFHDQASRALHAGELRAELERELAREPVGHWLEVLRQAGLMAAPVHRWKDVVRSAQFADNELCVSAEHDGDKVFTVRTPARYSTFEARSSPHLPHIGEHTPEVRS